MHRLPPILYWTAVTLFLVGTSLLVAASASETSPLQIPGEVVTGLAWPVAAVGAVLDMVRHRHHHDPVE